MQRIMQFNDVMIKLLSQVLGSRSGGTETVRTTATFMACINEVLRSNLPFLWSVLFG